MRENVAGDGTLVEITFAPRQAVPHPDICGEAPGWRATARSTQHVIRCPGAGASETLAHAWKLLILPAVLPHPSRPDPRNGPTVRRPAANPAKPYNSVHPTRARKRRGNGQDTGEDDLPPRELKRLICENSRSWTRQPRGSDTRGRVRLSAGCPSGCPCCNRVYTEMLISLFCPAKRTSDRNDMSAAPSRVCTTSKSPDAIRPPKNTNAVSGSHGFDVHSRPSTSMNW